jgi:hypothetical protein
VNLLDLTPVTAADAEEQDGRVVVIRPKPRPRGLLTPFDWLVYLMAPRRLRLDDVGSFCWRHMDGRRTAGDIAEALRAELGASVEPAEERLGKFIQMLQREELVSFLDLDR